MKLTKDEIRMAIYLLITINIVMGMVVGWLYFAQKILGLT